MQNHDIIYYAYTKGESIIPEGYNWKYCVANSIPYILVHPRIKYASIEFDLLSIDSGIKFKEDHRFYDRWLIFYNKYCQDSHLPDQQYLFIGGTNHGIFIIRKSDCKEVIRELISQIRDHVKLYRIIDSSQPHEKGTASTIY